MEPLPRVLVIPSWYPSDESPTNGIFIYQQVRALAAYADVAVLYVQEALAASVPRVVDEDGILVARADLAMPRASRTLPGRVTAVLTNLFNRFVARRRTGAQAWGMLSAAWGMPDIIHVQALWPAALIARDISLQFGIPYVVTEHSEEYSMASNRRLVKVPGMLPLVLRPLATRAARTLVPSRFLSDRLAELGLAHDSTVIPNVVPDAEPEPLPGRLPHVILHVSIMSPAKNLLGLVDAVDALRRRRVDFVLWLVGDGEMRESVHLRVHELDLGDMVRFMGLKSPAEVRALHAECAFTVISSIHETFSVVAAESLMSGRPVLSTRCGGPEEFVTPEVGRLIQNDNVEALADGLDWMLDHYRDFDPQALHEYARKRFAPDVVAEQIIAVYRSVLDA